MTQGFVLDTSLALAWCFENELTSATQEVLELLGEGTIAFVPALWAWEINNTLAMAERAQRITSTKRLQISTFLQTLPIELDEAAHSQTWGTTFVLAQEHRLSVYDAAYLEMAIRFGSPVGTLDKDLRLVAKKLGMKVLPETF